MYLRIYISMARTKVTLSVDQELLREAKSTTVKHGITLSSAFETLLKSFTKREIEEVADALGISIKYVSLEDVVKRRKAGWNAGRAVREMRDARAQSLLGH